MLLCHQVEQEAHTAYFAGALWSMVQYASMGKSNFPTWGEAFPKPHKDDGKTAAEIKQGLVARLLKKR